MLHISVSFNENEVNYTILIICWCLLPFQNISELEHIEAARKEKLLKWKQTLQPVIVAVGPEVDEVYVKVDEHMYRVSGIQKAIDICFKFFFALQAKYPIESEQVWQFIQLYFYNIETRQDKKFVGVNTLINDLNNIAMFP